MIHVFSEVTSRIIGVNQLLPGGKQIQGENRRKIEVNKIPVLAPEIGTPHKGAEWST